MPRVYFTSNDLPCKINPKKNIAGRILGRWLAIKPVGRTLMRNGNTRCLVWLCRCECGTEKAIAEATLRPRGSTSCGCYQREVVSTHRATWGGKPTKAYTTWLNMLERCRNPNHPHYRWYGARGIQVCERWKYFETFLEDMGQPPTPKHSLERVNNDGNYEPDNVIWIPRREQVWNKRTTRRVTVNGVTKAVAQWAREVGLRPQTIISRLNAGWTDEQAVRTPKLHGVGPHSYHPRD